MLPTARDVRAVLESVRGRASSITEGELLILSRALSLCNRDDDNGIGTAYSELADGNDLQQDVVEYLAGLEPLPMYPIHDALYATFRRDPQFYEAMHAMIAIAIPMNDRPVALDALQGHPACVLEALTRSDPIWQYDMTISDVLTRRGLPSSRSVLRRKLAILIE